jgi:GAF domain-containing protein
LAATASELLGVRKTTAQTIEPGYQYLKLIHFSEFSEEFGRHFHRVGRYDGSVCSRAMLSRSPILIEDVMLDPDCRLHWAIFEAANVRTVLSVPVITPGGAFYGMVSTLNSRCDVPTHSEIAEIKKCAASAAQRISKIRSRQPVRI